MPVVPVLLHAWETWKIIKGDNKVPHWQDHVSAEETKPLSEEAKLRRRLDVCKDRTMTRTAAPGGTRKTKDNLETCSWERKEAGSGQTDWWLKRDFSRSVWFRQGERSSWSLGGWGLVSLQEQQLVRHQHLATSHPDVFRQRRTGV